MFMCSLWVLSHFLYLFLPSPTCLYFSVPLPTFSYFFPPPFGVWVLVFLLHTCSRNRHWAAASVSPPQGALGSPCAPSLGGGERRSSARGPRFAVRAVAGRRRASALHKGPWVRRTRRRWVAARVSLPQAEIGRASCRERV